MGGRPYPGTAERCVDAGDGRALSRSGAGTATPRAYEFARNDDVIAMNQFAGVLTSATQAVAAALDTQAAEFRLWCITR